MNETSADGGEEAPAARPPAPEMKLSTAVKMGLGSTVTKLLEKRDAARSEALHEIDEGGHTVTHWAAKVGNIEIFRALLDAGAPFDVASSDKVAMFPLHWASTEGHLRVMRELVHRGADVDARDAQGCTALLIAAHVALDPDEPVPPLAKPQHRVFDASFAFGFIIFLVHCFGLFWGTGKARRAARSTAPRQRQRRGLIFSLGSASKTISLFFVPT